MARCEKYRLSCVKGGVPVWITDFDADGTFSFSEQLRLAVTFDNYGKVYHAMAFLEACHPQIPFEISRVVAVPCRGGCRSLAPLQPVCDG